MKDMIRTCRKRCLLLTCLTIGFVAFVTAQDSSPRRQQLFNFGWKFHFGEAQGAETPNYDDSGWRPIDLPHDFQIEQPWDQKASPSRGFKQMSTGWYRKTFDADPAWKGKRVILDFEGIMYVGDVWVNGVKAGGTDYGYLGFETDITRLIDYNGKNVVAVHASTQRNENSRWYTGGGLYRDVHLLLKDNFAIARHGVFVSTPTILTDHADVQVQVALEGLRGKKHDLDIEASIFAPDGRQVAQTKLHVPTYIRKLVEELNLPIARVEHPQLWSCETPHLYTTEVRLMQGDKVIDSVRETFGIRTIEFSNQFGLKVNGKKVFLKGLADHHDLGAVGVAAYDRAIERLFKQMKAFGFNHVRTSHNPYSKSFLRLADQYGLLVVDELFDKWAQQFIGGRVSFPDLWYKAIPEWIKRDRNHPSVIMWSYGNELQNREDMIGFPTGDWGVTGYRILDVLAKRYDPTRKSTVAMFPAQVDAIGKNDPEAATRIEAPELATVTDVSSFNYRYFNYDKYLKKDPHMIVYQSEATTNELGAPFFGMNYNTMVGLAYWGAVEYWGESNGWPRKGWNFSFFNHALEPFPQAYLIKSMFADEPVVHIGVVDNKNESIEWNDVVVGRTPISSHWNRTKGSKQNIYTYTNAEEVELLVNGRSMGVKSNETNDINRRNRVYWEDIPYSEGNVTAIARIGGKEVARHRLETTGKAVALKMEVESPNDWRADGLDLQYIRVYAVDSKGRVVPNTTGEVTFEVTGEAARLIAVDNGDHSSNELFAGNKRSLHKGFAMAILRAGRSPGQVTIKATVPQLRAAKRTLTTK